MQEIISQMQYDIRENQKLIHISIFNTVLSVIIIILLLLHCCPQANCEPTPTTPQFDITVDPNIDWGERETRPPEEIQEELRQKVEDGMMNISMNTNPVFTEGTAAGNLLITNAAFNNYSQIVEIYRDDTGECIYRSGVIPVGARIDNAKLLMDVSAGVYDCTAHFNQIDESGNLLGKACAKIQIYVLN